MKNAKWLRPVLAVLVLVAVVFLVLFIAKKIKEESPSEVEMPLTDYFNLQNKDDYVVYYNNVRTTDFHVRIEDDVIYLPFEEVKSMLNDRFYYEPAEETLYYTTDKKVIRVNPGKMSYYEGNENVDTSYKVLIDREDMYLALQFVEKFTDIGHITYIEPNRLMIYDSKKIDEERVVVNSETELRYAPSIKSDIVDKTITDAELIWLDQDSSTTDIEDWQKDWAYVQTLEGVRGYIKKKTIGDSFEIQTKYVNNKEYEEPNYKHIYFDKGDVVMLWHGIYSSTSNTKITNILTTSPGVNVVSPTWFKIKDAEGNLSDSASKSYVSECHDAGVQVWGLVSNFEDESINTTDILVKSASRENLENQIILMALTYELDGINVDFEAVLPEAREAYVQFIRELALKCHDNKLILSVDNYVPTEYTLSYNRQEQSNYADYVVIMAYDEHYSGSDEGSVSSISFVKDGINNTIDLGVPSEQIIVGLPFYTRIWEETPKSDTENDSVEAASDDFRSYTLKSEAVSMAEARQKADSNGAEIRWNDSVGQNYCEYKIGEKTYKIWIEDAKSLEEKLKAVKEAKVSGVSFWSAGLETSDVWETIGNYYK